MGHAVALFVEALAGASYKLEGSRFESRWSDWNSLT